ncbi:MAG: FAD-dependent thymidylate synthase [Candidatus Aenigmarchaeota archaeon]|nr:FAD-dependent thymidylate synthase [Candidatus Aenigmarchaeota archaeon]
MPETLLKFWENDQGIPVEEFTDEEVQTLSNVVSNTDSNIFAWKIGDILTPEQIGALLSRYSRTIFTGKKLFLKEFLPNKDRGREFFEAWLVDYGDDSIQEMSGGLPVSCEFVSNLAVKEIEESRIGSYIEKSTRYVFFDKTLPNGEFMFYKDPDILNSRYADEYLNLMRSLLASYTTHMEMMLKYISDLNPFESQTFRIGDAIVKVSELTPEIEEKYGITETDLKKAYDNSVKANALDLIRDYLPMATLTHVGINMNARSYENLVLKLLSSPLAESKWIGQNIYAELNKLVPSLIKRVPDKHGMAYQEFFKGRTEDTFNLVNQVLAGVETNDSTEQFRLVGYTGKGAENPDDTTQVILTASILYKFGHGHSMSQLIEKAILMPREERKKIIAAYVGNRVNRRHKPGRAFESVEYLFDLNARVGIFRDIQRHRVCTQERQNFTVNLGYNTRKEFKEIGISDDYENKMRQVIDLFNKLHPILPFQAQYVVTFGFNTRWYYRLNARQLFHLCELRTTPGGHPDYRKLVQDMFYAVQKVHPTVAAHMKFINLEDRPLGRLESEVRIAVKKKALVIKQ